MKTVETTVMAALSDLQISDDGLRAVLAGQLDRKLYLKTNEILALMGGKWNTKARAHLFAADVRPRLDSLFLTGQIERPKSFGYFPTPAAVVEVLLRRAELAPGMKVLEPSAGQGAIADALRASGAVVECVELLRDNCEVLRKKGHPVFCLDFMETTPIERYDRVVMNPPFERLQDIDHVKHAFKFLKEDGLLVSVMSAGVTFRNDRRVREFRELRGLSVEALPEDSFKESGTGVNAVVVSLWKR